MTEQAEQAAVVTGSSGQQPALTHGDMTQADTLAWAAALRKQADELESSVPAAPGTSKLKVEEPHESFSFGAAWVGPDWTSVGDHLVPGVMQAAREAGVTITQQEG
jgi:hypothetical protein